MINEGSEGFPFLHSMNTLVKKTLGYIKQTFFLHALFSVYEVILVEECLIYPSLPHGFFTAPYSTKLNMGTSFMG
jgi:hypothetical protein